MPAWCAGIVKSGRRGAGIRWLKLLMQFVHRRGNGLAHQWFYNDEAPAVRKHPEA